MGKVSRVQLVLFQWDAMAAISAAAVSDHILTPNDNGPAIVFFALVFTGSIEMLSDQVRALPPGFIILYYQVFTFYLIKCKSNSLPSIS